MERRFRNWALAIGLGVCVGAAVFAAGGGSVAPQAEPPAGRMAINGVQITQDEWELHVGLSRALVADYFHQAYGAQYSPQFWETPYSEIVDDEAVDGEPVYGEAEYGEAEAVPGETGRGGKSRPSVEVPLDKLVADVRERLLRSRAQQQLAQADGVLEGTGFAAYQEALEAENARRQQAADNGDIVYGPQQYGMRTFYNYYFSMLRQMTIEQMWETDWLAAAEQAAAQRYASQGDAGAALGERPLERPSESLSVAWAMLSYGQAEEPERKQALGRIEQLREALREGEPFAESAEQLGIPSSEGAFTAAARRSLALEYPRAIAALDGLETGETSEVVADNGAYHVFQLLEREGGDAVSAGGYEDVREALVAEALESMYEERVQAEMAGAQVEWDAKLAARWSLEALGTQ